MSTNNLDLIVNVTVSRETPALSQQDFNAAMFITQDQVFTERVKTYTSSQDLLTDGFDVDSDTYKAVRSFFSQGGKVNEILVGRRDASVVELTLAGSPANNTDYSITLQGTTFTYTSDADATVAEIIDGLQALIAADVPVSTEVVATSDSVTLTLTEQTGYTLNLKSVDLDQFNINYATQETWAAAIAAINAVNDTWYVLTTYDHSIAGSLAIAAEVESLDALYFVSNQNSENLEAISGTPDPNNLIGQLAALNYDKTVAAYSATADDTYLETGWVGERIWTEPGASQWGLSQVKGVVADKLTGTQITNLEASNGNYFITYANIDAVLKGTTVSGEWIDTMRGGDSMASDVQVAVAKKLFDEVLRGSKVPLTENGVAQLKEVVASVCEQYVSRGFIKDLVDKGDGTSRRGYQVYSAAVADLTSNQRANREAPTIQVTADLAGAVIKSTIQINLYV